MLKRRTLLQLAGSGVLSVPLVTARAFAAAPTSKRFVLLILRGGVDGLHMVAPWADRDYRRLRPSLALYRDSAPDAALNIDGYFAFHPQLAPLAELYRRGELSILPAATTRYRERSHFDGQNVLETGAAAPYGAADGWLNRAVAALNDGDQRLGLALGPGVPLVLQGPAAVQTWSNTRLPPLSEEFLFRLAQMYTADAAFASALEQAQGTPAPALEGADLRMGPLESVNLAISAQAAAELLARPDGPRIAVLESEGWDSHFDQERRLAQLFAGMSGAVAAMESGLGNAWRETVIMVVSEFGRTAAENGSRGTDHGTGGIALLAGGAVRGGRLLGSWPGLSRSALFAERDLRATSAYEGVFKSILMEHLGVREGYVEDRVFPGSRGIAPTTGLFHI